MRFTSKHAALQVPVRDEQRDYTNNPNGRLVRPALWVDFAEGAWTERYEHSELGTYESIAGGGHYDTVEAQSLHGWTDEEREAVEEKLLSLCPNAPQNAGVRIDDRLRASGYGDCELLIPAVPAPPWPTYDELHHNRIAPIAVEMGLVDQALMYEERTKKRPDVLRQLKEKVQEREDAKALTAA